MSSYDTFPLISNGIGRRYSLSSAAYHEGIQLHIPKAIRLSSVRRPLRPMLPRQSGEVFANLPECRGSASSVS